MTSRIPRIIDWCLIGTTTAAPLLAAFYLGITAHGQHVSTVERINSLTYMSVAGAMALRIPLWVLRGKDRRPLLRHLAGQLALLAGAWCLYRLGFQSGLAVHCPPQSFLEFFTMEP